MPSRAAESGPITRLPDEVLSIVFFYYAVCLHESLYTRKWTHTILRINRHWRELALHTPILWSFFSSWTLPDARPQDKLLQSSYAHPLSLKLSPVIASQVNWTFALMEAHKDRVQDVEVYAQAQMIEHISSRLRSNWKSLRHLSLWSVNFRYDLPSHVAQDLILGLCTLRLVNVRLDWTIVRNVRHLRMAGKPQLGSITINALSNVLRSCPTLQTLELFDCVYRGHHESDKIREPIELPHLRRIEIRASSSVCSSVLGLMSLHPSTAILFDVDNMVDAKSIRPLLIHLCKHLLARGRPPRLRSLQFISSRPEKGRKTNCWMRFLWDDCLPFAYRSLGAEGIPYTTQLELRVVPLSARELHRIVTKVLNIVPTHAVEVLDMRSSAYTPTRTLRALLRGLPAVRSIYLASRAVNVSVLESILHLIEAGNLQGPTHAPYKKPLKPPALEQVFWDTRTTAGAERPVVRETVCAIRKLLQAYKSVGRPIRQVSLSKRPDGMPAAIFAVCI
ncbi:hypothetical protein EV122DRAFT_216084 [Schizophyllum commune]